MDTTEAEELIMTSNYGINLAWAVPHPPILVAGIGSTADLQEARATYDAYVEVASQIVAADPELLVVSTPHGQLYRDCFNLSRGTKAQGDWKQFRRDPERYEVIFDESLTHALQEQANSAGIPCVESLDTTLDHGLMVPLHFLLKAGLSTERCKFVRIPLSFLGDKAHYNLGRCVQEVALKDKRRTVFIASGDLSHCLKKDGPYGFTPEGPAFDQAITEAFEAGDFARFFSFEDRFREKAGECGLSSFLIMAGVFHGFDVHARLYSYEGPWGVGYGTAGFERSIANDTRRLG